MALRTKKTPLRKPLFLLAAVSAFVLSMAVGHCADERLDAAGNNVTVHTILQVEVPIPPQVQHLATCVIQQGKKLFISYCWDKKYSTVPMVNDFEKFIQGRGITEYYRDTRKEIGYGMTLGVNIEDFMKNAGKCDAVVIFLNDAYLRSFNCMREFFQVWNANNKEISPKALIIRHPDFGGLFERGDAAGPYREHWEGLYETLRGKRVPAADRKRLLDEMAFASEVEGGISSIINAIAGNIQVNYLDLRKNGFEDVFRLALAGEAPNPGVVGIPSAPVSPHKAGIGFGEQHPAANRPDATEPHEAHPQISALKIRETRVIPGFVLLPYLLAPAVLDYGEFHRVTNEYYDALYADPMSNAHPDMPWRRPEESLHPDEKLHRAALDRLGVPIWNRDYEAGQNYINRAAQKKLAEFIKQDIMKTFTMHQIIFGEPHPNMLDEDIMRLFDPPPAEAEYSPDLSSQRHSPDLSSQRHSPPVKEQCCNLL